MQIFLFLFLSLCVFIVFYLTIENFCNITNERLCSSFNLIIGWHELIGFNIFFIFYERILCFFRFFLGFVKSCGVLLHSKAFDNISGWFTLFLLDPLDLFIAHQFWFYLWDNFNGIKFYITVLFRKLKISFIWVVLWLFGKFFFGFH
jgi:hypothetical protein